MKTQEIPREDKSKIPLIVFGNGMFIKDVVKLKGIRCGATSIMWRCLKKREAAGDLLVVPIDEYKTSKNCFKCKTATLGELDHVKGESVLGYKTCKTLWQRDVNASKNMMKISLAVWKGFGRTSSYCRS